MACFRLERETPSWSGMIGCEWGEPCIPHWLVWASHWVELVQQILWIHREVIGDGILHKHWGHARISAIGLVMWLNTWNNCWEWWIRGDGLGLDHGMECGDAVRLYGNLWQKSRRLDSSRLDCGGLNGDRLDRCGNCDGSVRSGISVRVAGLLCLWFVLCLFSFPLFNHNLWDLIYSGIPPGLAIWRFNWWRCRGEVGGTYDP